jgi:hypothetical protein
MNSQKKRHFLRVAAITGMAVALLLEPVSRGTTMARLSFEELAQKATAIARLRCLNVTSKWDKNEIWTETQFAVVEQNKGALGATITVRMLGGDLGNLHSRVDGVPSFRPGEEAYVFLWSREGEPYRILGWSQGAFRIAKDARTGTEKVTQDAAATTSYQPQSRQFVRAGIRGMPVADFRQKLKQTLAAKVL